MIPIPIVIATGVVGLAGCVLLYSSLPQAKKERVQDIAIDYLERLAKNAANNKAMIAS